MDIYEKMAAMSMPGLLPAVVFAAEAHKHQKRKSDGSSYICHPLRVALFLQETQGFRNEAILTAALLHDVVEDCAEDARVMLATIREKFGEAVASIVEEVTDDRSLTRAERKRAQIAHIAHCSYEARFVKAADMWDNLSSLLEDAPPHWSVERVQGYFVWKRFVFDSAQFGNIPSAFKLCEMFEDKFFKPGLTFKHHGEEHPIMPEGDLRAFLENYLASV